MSNDHGPSQARRGVLLRPVRHPESPDQGDALVLVVGSMMVLAMLSLTALAYTVSNQRFARNDQDYNAAMAAAQSGVEDFISRLNRDDTYWRTVDCTNAAWHGPMTVANSCGWTTATAPGWLPVQPGETGVTAPVFHYAIDTTGTASGGPVTVTSTGRVNGVYRTVESTVGKGSSSDYVYYTDFESADPSNVQAYPTTPAAECGGAGYDPALYWWEGRGSGCVEITFIGDDTLDGPVFTNDSILSSGAHFQQGVETGNPACDTATSSSGTWDRCLRSGSTANFNGIQPKRAALKYLDDTSAAFVGHPGCHYYGSTRIVFNSDGTMTVWNARSVNDNTAPVAIAPPSGSAPTCGTLDQLDSPTGDTVQVPNDMVVYVGASTAARRQCYAGEIRGASGRTLPLGTYDAAKAAGPTGSGQSYKADTNMLEAPKACAEGNLYAEGTVKGRVTVAAAQSVVVTGDLVLAGGINGTDMLGLVATNSVEVFHPRIATISSVNSGSWFKPRWTWDTAHPSGEQEAASAGYGTWPTRVQDPSAGRNEPASGIQIAGSIQTLQHSFLVQKYAVGENAGQLLVRGSIAQRWRGIVGRGTGASMTGYKKLYTYDTRLKMTRPPYFPNWANSQWGLTSSGEIATPTALRSAAP